MVAREEVSTGYEPSFARSEVGKRVWRVEKKTRFDGRLWVGRKRGFL